MKRPELLVTAAHLSEVEPLIEAGADAISIGEARFGLRNAGPFSVEEIDEAVAIAHRLGARVYVNCNALLHNDDLEGLEDYLRHLETIGADAIVFSDPSVLVTAKAAAPGLALHWSADMLTTNYETINYWASKGVSRAVLARELTIDETVENKAHTTIEIQAQVHGVTCIFQSRRDLVTAYFGYQGRDLEREDTSIARGMFIKEEKRQNISYPIYEDQHGTHVLSAEDICMIDSLEEFLAGGIDSLKIEGLAKKASYNLAVTRLYREAIDLCASDVEAYRAKVPAYLEAIRQIQPPNRPLNTGFYFKPPIPY